MANEFELSAELRTDLGKGASRRLRRLSGMVPAILYGAGKDPISLSITQKDIEKSCENEAFFAHIITLKVAGKSENAIVKALQRHPANDRILHADFQRVQMDQEIHVDVPLHFLNEETCVGVKQDGGMISHVMTSLRIACLPGALPEYIQVDVENIQLGSALHMSDLVLPDGVTVPELIQGGDHDQVVVSVISTRASLEATEEESVDDSEVESESKDSSED